MGFNFKVDILSKVLVLDWNGKELSWELNVSKESSDDVYFIFIKISFFILKFVIIIIKNLTLKTHNSIKSHIIFMHNLI